MKTINDVIKIAAANPIKTQIMTVGIGMNNPPKSILEKEYPAISPIDVKISVLRTIFQIE